MTIPNIIANFRAQQLRTAFLKGYSVITQAFEMYHKDTDCSGTDCIASVLFYQAIKPYFKILKLCEHTADLKSDDCMPKNTTDMKYQNFNKTSRGIKSAMFDDGQFITTDGMLITFEQQTSGRKSIFIGLDVNGRRKAPNVLGQDLFLFQLVNKSGRGFILPVGAVGTDYLAEQFCSLTSTSRENGYGCAAKALYDPNFFKNLK